MNIKIKTQNGQEFEVPLTEVERAYAATRGTGTTNPPAATGTGAPLAADPTIIALRETVAALATNLDNERKERAQERAEAAVDGLIAKGKILPANREHWTKVYLSDRATFDALTKVLPVTKRVANPDDANNPAHEFGTGAAGEGSEDDNEGDGRQELSDGESRNNNDRVRTGADARWNREIEKIKAEQKVSDRQAGEILSLREPNLWHARREELAGMRLPKVRQANNRHMIQ